MARNSYYRSAHWHQLRRHVLKRDDYRCTVKGCGAEATHVDHIQTRPNSDVPTWADNPGNLRSLCAHHDAQIKEQANGARRLDGRPIVSGCSADGSPLDPRHPWAR